MRSTFFKGAMALFTLLFVVSLNSCQKDTGIDGSNGLDVQAGEVDLDNGEVLPTDYRQYKDQLLKHVDDLGVNLDMVQEVEIARPDGSTDRVFQVGGDIELTRTQLQEIRNEVPGRQYNTNNLVSNNQTITVIGYNSGSFGLTSKMRTALSWAVANYNALNIGLNFSLSFSGSTSADIVVYRQYNNSGAGGSAGFPSGGNPYKWVQIYAGMENYNTNVNEHVMTHEIGHCLGMRHTDYFSRASCGQNSNEGSAGVGANHVPGTPTGIDWNSIMLACFSSSEDGEFGYYDRVAFEYLY
jgi:hypothetical protein